MSKVSFKVSAYESWLVDQIVRRLKELDVGPGLDFLSIAMDITACHTNGCPLHLGALLNAGGPDFVHDISGIVRHMDRNTGKLLPEFQPRFALENFK